MIKANKPRLLNGASVDARTVVRMSMNLIIAGLAMTTHLVSAPMAAPAGGGSPAISVAIKVSPPMGFLRFCSDTPLECLPAGKSEGAQDFAQQVRHDFWSSAFAAASEPRFAPGAVSAPAAAALASKGGEIAAEAQALEGDAPTLSLIKNVNERINREIRPRTDKELYGVSDYWALPLESGVRQGDCEDYVLEKRRALRNAGIALGALSIALVTTARNEAHAVLLVNTDHGILVLDNLTSSIVTLDHAPYRLVERQAFGSTMEWVSYGRPLAAD